MAETPETDLDAEMSLTELESPDVEWPLMGPSPESLAIRSMSDSWSGPGQHGPHAPVIDTASGCWITTSDNNRMLDLGAGGGWCLTGYQHPRVVNAVQRQATRLLSSSHYSSERAELLQRLGDLSSTRGSNPKTHLTASPDEAIDIALRLARWYTGRPSVISFVGSFHGNTCGALSVSATRASQRRGLLGSDVTFAQYPDPSRMGDRSENQSFGSLRQIFSTILRPDRVAAILVEPMQTENGLVIPPETFLPELRNLCDHYGTLLIVDETFTGGGRTGAMWAGGESEADIMVVGPGIASGMPLSAVVASSNLMSWSAGAHGRPRNVSTLACAAAMETLDLIQEGLQENAEILGNYMLEEVKEYTSDLDNIGEVRGRGMMLAVEFVKASDRLARAPTLRNRVVRHCYKLGLIVSEVGKSAIALTPALNISKAELDVGLELFAEALERST